MTRNKRMVAVQKTTLVETTVSPVSSVMKIEYEDDPSGNKQEFLAKRSQSQVRDQFLLEIMFLSGTSHFHIW